MNSNCAKILGPCTCGAWHKSPTEFSASTIAANLGDIPSGSIGGGLSSIPPVGRATMVQAATGGLRDNKGKARLALVPSCLERSVAEVIFRSSDLGGGKYPLHNWRKGLPWSEVAESGMRHLKAFAQDGEDFDPESGLHHLKHAACNIAFLLEYLTTHPEMDDRFKKGAK